MPAEIFISYCVRDLQLLRDVIIPVVEQVGRSWDYYDPDNPWPGKINRQILNRLKECKRLIVVVSRNSITSDYVAAEVKWVLQRRKNLVNRVDVQVIPVLMEECDSSEIELRLNLFSHINFAKSRAEGREQLRQLLGHAIAPIALPAPADGADLLATVKSAIQTASDDSDVSFITSKSVFGKQLKDVLQDGRVALDQPGGNTIEIVSRIIWLLVQHCAGTDLARFVAKVSNECLADLELEITPDDLSDLLGKAATGDARDVARVIETRLDQIFLEQLGETDRGQDVGEDDGLEEEQEGAQTPRHPR